NQWGKYVCSSLQVQQQTHEWFPHFPEERASAPPPFGSPLQKLSSVPGCRIQDRCLPTRTGADQGLSYPSAVPGFSCRPLNAGRRPCTDYISLPLPVPFL